MNYRYMRTLLMFDLPVETVQNRRDYRKFVKFIMGMGFVRMQKSVFSKLTINEHAVSVEKNKVADNLPHDGMISWLTITEKQFQEIDNLLGDPTVPVEMSDKRYLEI